MKDRITQHFKARGKEALIAYIMGGDPDYETSLKLLKALPGAGADIIELGMPFTDPAAEGPTIQAAGDRALASGMSLKRVLAMTGEFRKKNNDTPLILMGYYNPIFRYGTEQFVADAKKSGVDGFIIVDLPPEEEAEFTRYSIPAKLALVKLTTPTTDGKRAKKILKNASGFVYYVSVTGITGTKSAQVNEIKKSLAMLRRHTKLPIAVGFGIKTPEQAAEIATIADGIVVGSALVKKIEENLNDREKSVAEVLGLVRALADAIVSPA